MQHQFYFGMSSNRLVRETTQKNFILMLRLFAYLSMPQTNLTAKKYAWLNKGFFNDADMFLLTGSGDRGMGSFKPESLPGSGERNTSGIPWLELGHPCPVGEPNTGAGRSFVASKIWGVSAPQNL